MGMASLQQHLVAQPPTTSGIHEAMAQHAEDVFEEFRGILPMFLGKRQLGPFINLTLPKRITQDNSELLQTVADIVLVYNLRVISFVSAVRMQLADSDAPALGALLITADRAKAYFQLPWQLAFDANRDLVQARRSEIDQDVIPRETRDSFFTDGESDQAKQVAYDRLVDRFGGAKELPKP